MLSSGSKKRTKDEMSPPPAPREVVSLPAHKVVSSKSLTSVLELLKQLMHGTNDDSKHPVVIGSRAAAYWLPSFRQFDDWDIIATPHQTYKILEKLQASQSSATLTISLIEQPLDKNVVRRKPVTPVLEAMLDVLPDNLYKVLGELEGVIKFEIEIIPLKNDGSLLETSSAAKLYNICNDGDDRAYLELPIGSNKCIVASLELLETLKTSHINWPAYFAKHIADLHSLRALIPPTSSNVNMGIRADKKKPLTSPERTPELEDFLFTRTLETEAFRGTAGAHINLNVSNEDFLGREDDLFVTRHIPHDDVHLLVKYGDIPIYDQLKTDNSKAMVSRKLFEEAPYDTQLKCVKEEAMVIALERFLLPELASDPSSAYKSALIRICTTLTKGWFRQFAIDNFPRLAVCDKDLLSIRDEILKKHPLPPIKKADPMLLLKQSISNLEELVVVQKLIPLIRSCNLSEAERIVNANKRRKRVYKDDDEDSEEEESEDDDSDEKMYGSDEEYGRRQRKSNNNYWIISSPEVEPLVLVSFINSSKFAYEDCKPSYDFNATLSVQALNSDTDLSHLEARLWRYKHNQKNIYSFQVISADVSSGTEGGSWGGQDIWGEYCTESQHVETEVMNLLDIEGLIEDLFVKFIMAVVQPKLMSNGETPLKTYINAVKVKGSLPLHPKNHLWYDLWKDDLTNTKEK